MACVQQSVHRIFHLNFLPLKLNTHPLPFPMCYLYCFKYNIFFSQTCGILYRMHYIPTFFYPIINIFILFSQMQCLKLPEVNSSKHILCSIPFLKLFFLPQSHICMGNKLHLSLWWNTHTFMYRCAIYRCVCVCVQWMVISCYLIKSHIESNLTFSIELLVLFLFQPVVLHSHGCMSFSLENSWKK